MSAGAVGVPPVPGKLRAAAAYAVFTLALMYPLSVHPGTLLPSDGPDTHLGIWMLGWDVHALTHNPLSIFDANTFYPHRHTLAYQDNYIGSAILIAPVLWLTGSPVTAVNAVPLLACVLCGLGGYVLARRLGYGALAAFLCGFIFAFCPSRFFRMTQLALAPVEWIPLTLASLHAYLDGGHRRDLRLACGFFALQTLTSGHGALFLVVAIVLLLGYRVLLGEPIRAAARIRDLGVIGAALLALAAVTYVPYYFNQVEIGLRRDLGLWDTTPESFLASPTPLHARVLSLLGWSAVNERASGFLFPGYLPIVLAAVGVAAMLAEARRRWRKSERHEAHANVGAGFDAATLWRDTRVRLVTAAAVTSLVLFAVRAAVPAGDGLVAEYVQSAGTSPIVLAGSSPTTRAITAAWHGAPPATFTARWTGFLAIGSDGVYQFATSSDDASRVFIDTTLVVDNGGRHASTTRAGQISLTPGSHRVVVEYEQYGGAWELSWLWARDGAPLRPVPTWRLSEHRAPYWLAVVARIVDWTIVATATLAAVLAAWLFRRQLAGMWTRWAQRAEWLRRHPVPFYLALALVCIGLSLGPPYSLWPYVYTWPGFSFVRVSRRFMILAAMAIAVLAAAGFDTIARRLTARRVRVAFLAAAAFLLAEFAYVPIDTHPFQLKIPAADRWLATQPKPFAIAEVPLPPNERYQTMYMLHSMAHWQKTVAGWGGIRPHLSEVLNGELRTFPDETSVRHLAELRVTYVVVHRDLYPQEAWPAVDARLREFERSCLALRYADDASRVYAITCPK